MRRSERELVRASRPCFVSGASGVSERERIRNSALNLRRDAS